MARPAGISTCRAHCQRTQAHHWRSFHTQNGPCRLGVANITEGTAKYFETNCLVVCVYFYSYPMAASGTGVKRGNGRRVTPDRPPRPSPAFRRLALHRPPPHAGGRGGTTWGSSASQPPVEFRPDPPWVVGAGSGRVPGPKLAAGTAASATCRISGSLGGPEIH